MKNAYLTQEKIWDAEYRRSLEAEEPKAKVVEEPVVNKKELPVKSRPVAKKSNKGKTRSR